MSLSRLFRHVFLLGVLLLSIGSIRAKSSWEGFRLALFIESGYNSNPALLANHEFSAFDSGDPDWMRLESKDDGFSRLGLEPGFRFKAGDLRIIGAIAYRFTKYYLNTEMDYHFINPSLTLRYNKLRCDLSYALIPEYTIALYTDDDYSASAKYWSEYSMSRGNLDIRYDLFKNHSFGIAGNIEYKEYNANFPEYDGVGYKIGPVWRWSGPIYVKINYAYRAYFARGFDNEGESLEDSDETDISYVEDRIEGYLSKEVFLFTHKYLFGLSLELSQRFYSSEKDFSVDYLHVGRRDLRADFKPFISYNFDDKTTIELEYLFTIRNADSPNYDVGYNKDFTRSIISLRLEYSIVGD